MPRSKDGMEDVTSHSFCSVSIKLNLYHNGKEKGGWVCLSKLL